MHIRTKTNRYSAPNEVTKPKKTLLCLLLQKRGLKSPDRFFKGAHSIIKKTRGEKVIILVLRDNVRSGHSQQGRWKGQTAHRHTRWRRYSPWACREQKDTRWSSLTPTSAFQTKITLYQHRKMGVHCQHWVPYHWHSASSRNATIDAKPNAHCWWKFGGYLGAWGEVRVVGLVGPWEQLGG